MILNVFNIKVKFHIKGGAFMKKLYRSENDRIVFGICGGIAGYFKIDSTLIRLAFLLLLFGSFFTFGLFYVIASLIIPKEWEVKN